MVISAFYGKSTFSDGHDGIAEYLRGIYPISLTFYLLGRPASMASQADIGPSGVDMTSDYRFYYDSGAEAILGSSSRVYRAAEATIRGTAGEIHIHAPFLRPHRMTVRTGCRAGGKPICIKLR